MSTSRSIEPNTAELHDNLGNVYRALNRLEEAWAAYTEAVRLNPGLALANAHIGLIFRSKATSPRRCRGSRRRSSSSRRVPCFWEWFGELFGELDEPAAAIPCWEQVVALEPESPSARIALGRALQEEGRMAEARSHYLKADELQPHASHPQINLGWLL